jgi:glycosyltransferase involved in cell wall biosynthesis
LKLNISICLITKNEADQLAHCLASVAGVVEEVVVVDTGSTDQTQQVARQYTDKVFNYNWQDDFAAARNFAVVQASHQMIWMIDSDETLKKINFDSVNKFIENSDKIIGKITIESRTTFNLSSGVQSKSEQIGRIFSRKYFKYSGRIHEQLVAIEPKKIEINYAALPIVLTHSGYLSQVTLVFKAKRDLKILRLELAAHPHDPYLLYQAGKCYSILQRFDSAINYFRASLALKDDPKKNYVYDCVETLSYTLNKVRQPQLGIRLLEQYPLYQTLADYWFLLGILRMNAALFQEAIVAFLQATRCQAHQTAGINSFLAYYNIGVIYEVLGQKVTAKKFYQKCGNYDLAKKGLQRIRK